MTKSAIDYVDRAWHIVTGCSHAGTPGCDNCYAAYWAATRLKHNWKYTGLANYDKEHRRGAWRNQVRFNAQLLNQPYRWRTPATVFVSPFGDVFHGRVNIDQIMAILDVIRQTPRHKYMLFTKRARRAALLLKMIDASEPTLITRNAMLVVSASTQAALDLRLPYLLSAPVHMRGLSLEPLLTAIKIPIEAHAKLNWAAIGGESGPNARPMHPVWPRAIIDQSLLFPEGATFWFKQWGEWAPDRVIDAPSPETPSLWLDTAGGQHDTQEWRQAVFEGQAFGWAKMYRVGKKAAGAEIERGMPWRHGPVWPEIGETA